MPLTPFQYRDFYDVPRMFIAQHNDVCLLFESAFDPDTDEYVSHYRVCVLPHLDNDELRGSWMHLAGLAIAELGLVLVESMTFDPTRRREVDFVRS